MTVFASIERIIRTDRRNSAKPATYTLHVHPSQGLILGEHLDRASPSPAAGAPPFRWGRLTIEHDYTLPPDLMLLVVVHP